MINVYLLLMIQCGYVCSSGDELEGYTPESRLATHRYIEKKRQEGKPKE